MKPYVHAKTSAAKWGGRPDDYIAIHSLIDESKSHVADHRHRALLHNAFGCFLVERVFGAVATNSEGKEYSPRDVAEQHIVEDLGHIPTVQDWLQDLPLKEWMGGGRKEEIPSRSAILDFASLRKKMESIKESLGDEFKNALGSVLESSGYNACAWVQFTDYFNDGEPCTFSVHDQYVTKNDSLDFDDIPRYCDGEDGWEHLGTPSSKSKKEEPMRQLAKAWRDLFDDELAESAFGDHKKVMWIRGKGWLVEEFEDHS